MAYLERDNKSGFHVWGFNGKHLGWFVKGVIWDEDGDASCAVKERLKSTEFEPFKSFKEFQPFKAFKEFVPPRPAFSDAFGSNSCRQAGATYTGNFLLKPKAADGWIEVRSSAPAWLPPVGNRIRPQQHAQFMPKRGAEQHGCVRTLCNRLTDVSRYAASLRQGSRGPQSAFDDSCWLPAPYVRFPGLQMVAAM